MSINLEATDVTHPLSSVAKACSGGPDDLVLARFEWHGIGKQRTRSHVCRPRATESQEWRLRDGGCTHVSPSVDDMSIMDAKPGLRVRQRRERAHSCPASLLVQVPRPKQGKGGMLSERSGKQTLETCPRSNSTRNPRSQRTTQTG